MELQPLLRNLPQLYAQALQERIKSNNDQIKTWTEYKKNHEKVIEGLGIFPQDLSLNCMVPIGKRALMKGKLIHTNEITVCLGDGYFAKYSAPQAIALCNRRIKKADEMLTYLQQERNLIEMRQMIPDNFDIFGDTNKKDFIEHWDDKKLENWREQHRQREKEYRKKLAALKNEKKQEIETEDDLFKRLDALELQEELEDELHRLEEEHEDYCAQFLDDGQYVDESEVDSESYSSDYSEEAINEVQEKKSSKLNHRLQVLNSVNSSVSGLNYESISNLKNGSVSELQLVKDGPTNCSIENQTKECSSIGLPSGVDGKSISEKVKIKEKKVAFAEPQVKYFSNEEEMESSTERRRVSVIEQRLYEHSKEDDESEDESDEDETINIYFKHSETGPILSTASTEITSPRDIYKQIPSPKSILKKTSQSSDLTTEEESEDEVEHISTYNSVVKEIQEHAPQPTANQDVIKNVNEDAPTKRPVSKFKLARAGLKK